MLPANLKFAYLLNGYEVGSREFEEAHFRQLLPTKAGEPIKNMIYQVYDAYCLYGIDIEKDEKIKRIANETTISDACHAIMGCTYYLELDQYQVLVFFIKIIRVDCIMFVFFDVK